MMKGGDREGRSLFLASAVHKGFSIIDGYDKKPGRDRFL